MLDRVVQTFEELIRRSLAPSMTFFALLAAGDILQSEIHGRDSAWDKALTYAELTSPWTFGISSAVFITLMLLVVIGVSYALSALQQLLFDNRLKKNFDPVLPVVRKHGSRASEAAALQELRARVRQRLSTESALPRLRDLREPSDYLLYEILGGIDPTSTRAFVDTAKAIGIACVSLILVLAGHGIYYFALDPRHDWWVLLVLGLVAAWVFAVGKDATAAQYRARALRLYVNFLVMPSDLIQRRLAQWGERGPAGAAGGAAP